MNELWNLKTEKSNTLPFVVTCNKAITKQLNLLPEVFWKYGEITNSNFVKSHLNNAL